MKRKASDVAVNEGGEEVESKSEVSTSRQLWCLSDLSLSCPDWKERR